MFSGHYDLNSDPQTMARSSGDAESTPKKLPYPKSVFLILGNEFCERFSYYGMRAILILYLKNVLKYGELKATAIYHGFAMLAYFTPLFGAMLADSILGKFRTILYLSMVYALGSIVLSLSATPPVHLPAIPFTMLGLSLIAVGTGGIKPCVSAFGADQFILPQQEKEQVSFFSIFYFAINAGSVISMFLTPVFREYVSCFGDTTCYSLAFSVPAALMITSIVVFLLGKSLYIIREPTGNVVLVVIRCIKYALSRKWRSDEKRKHWLDYADDKYYPRDIHDIKIVLGVLFLYLPLPVFWALLDQQGSTWTLQASRMKGNVGSYVFLPDQMQVINPVLVLTLIPIFDRYIYPTFGKCGLLKKPLQRLTTGGFLAGIAFVVSGLVELQLEKTNPVELLPGQSNLNFISMVPHNLTGRFINGPEGFPTIPTDEFYIGPDSSTHFGVVPSAQYEISFKTVRSSVRTSFTLRSQNASSLVITPGVGDSLVFTFPENTDERSEINSADPLKKSSDGSPLIRIIQVGLWTNHLESPEEVNRNRTLTENLAHKITLVEAKKQVLSYSFAYQANFSVYSDWRSTPSREIEAGVYKVIIGEGAYATELDGVVKVEFGGSYILTVIAEPGPTKTYRFQLNNLVLPNSLHMFWLFPQYLIISMAEVMFSITVMDFSYSQAPKSMKSVMQSAWQMTVAFGNLIVVLVAESRFFDKQWKEFFLFSGLMFLDMLIFSYMAYRYRPVPKVESTENDELLPKYGREPWLESDEDDLNRSTRSSLSQSIH